MRVAASSRRARRTSSIEHSEAILFSNSQHTLAGVAASSFASRSSHDLFDQLRLGGAVGVHIGPILLRQSLLQRLITSPIPVACAQAIPKQEMTLNLLASYRKNMEMDVPFGSSQHAVLMPIRLPHAKDIARRRKLRQITAFVPGVIDHEKDVDDGFRRQPDHRCRADVLDSPSDLAERPSDHVSMTLEFSRPLGIIADDRDRALFRAPISSALEDVFVMQSSCKLRRSFDSTKSELLRVELSAVKPLALRSSLQSSLLRLGERGT